MTSEDALLIGVDGGATEVKARAVSGDDLSRPSSFKLRSESASRVYPRVADFAPVALAEQLAQRDADNLALTAKEAEQGRRWVQAAAEAIADAARQCDARRILVGVGMPGLKTPDGRGICVVNNGPRIPDYLDALEKHLAAAGIELVSPVAALGSDADYCGLGEEYAAEGLFRDVKNAYYVGGGTGVADAMKLRGRLVPLDEAQSWIQKGWQIPSALGPTFEKLISASSLNRVYANLVAAGPRTGREGPEQATEARKHEGTKRSATTRYPEVAAAGGDPLAVAWMDTAALVLAELICERLHTIKNGRAEATHRGEAYAELNPDHEYRGLLLDRVVIGQRVGQIYADPAYRGVFGEKLEAYLAAFIAVSNDPEMAGAYLARSAGPPSPPSLKPGFVQPSRLRAAPALGAAVAAARALRSG